MGIARGLIRNADSLALTDSKSAFECRCTLGDFPAGGVGAAAGSLFHVTGRERTSTAVLWGQRSVRKGLRTGEMAASFSPKGRYRRRGRWSKGEERDFPGGPVVKHQ